MIQNIHWVGHFSQTNCQRIQFGIHLQGPIQYIFNKTETFHNWFACSFNVTSKRNHRQTARVLVRSNVKPALNIVFVFDCQSKMKAKNDVVGLLLTLVVTLQRYRSYSFLLVNDECTEKTWETDGRQVFIYLHTVYVIHSDGQINLYTDRICW